MGFGTLINSHDAEVYKLPDGYFRIKNVHYSERYLGSVSGDVRVLSCANGNVIKTNRSAATVVKMLKQEDNLRYAFQIQGKYIREVDNCSQVMALNKNNEKNKFYWHAKELNSPEVTFLINDKLDPNEKNAFHASATDENAIYSGEEWKNENQYPLVRWAFEDCSPSFWTIEEAEEFDIAMHTLGQKSYATLFVPFACVPIDSKTKIYSATIDETKKYIFLTEIEGVLAANTPVIVISEAEQMKATFSIKKEGGTSIPNNCLTGVLTQENVNGKENYFLGNYGNKPKFGHWKTTSENQMKTINTNRVYYKPSEKTVATALPFKFNTIEGIDIVDNVITQSQPVYNIQGQRVKRMKKGQIYIINGEKWMK